MDTCVHPAEHNRTSLRLEWIEAGSLSPNPMNWRRHPEAQKQALRSVLADPEIGWAGALLFNERTGRLIDGHARKEVSDPNALVPVLVGSWSEEAERKILATLDPISAMAEADAAILKQLLEMADVGAIPLEDMYGISIPEEGGLEKSPSGELVRKFGVPPFSIFDTRQQYWQDRKRLWLSLGIQSELGREAPPGGGGGIYGRKGISAKYREKYKGVRKAKPKA